MNYEEFKENLPNDVKDRWSPDQALESQLKPEQLKRLTMIAKMK